MTDSKNTLTLNNNASCFICLQGYLVRIGKMCLINSPRSGLYWLKWKNDRIPAKLGDRITIFGQLVTLDLGRAFYILHAELISPTRMKEFKRFLKS